MFKILEFAVSLLLQLWEGFLKRKTACFVNDNTVFTDHQISSYQYSQIFKTKLFIIIYVNSMIWLYVLNRLQKLVLF